MRKCIRVGFYGVVLGGLVAGSVAWTLVDKTVTIRVDGVDRSVHTVARTVTGALEDAGIDVDNHDVIAPSVDSTIKDGSIIVVRQGRLVKLTVDGKGADVWVTATTVEQALAQLGYDAGNYASVSRSKRLPLDPTTIELRTAKSVAVVADGVSRSIVTTGVFASDAVTAAGVTFSASDLWSMPASTPLATGMTVTLQRVTFADVAEAAPIPYATTQAEDSTVSAGTTVVDTPGIAGQKAVTYRVTYTDGIETARQVLVEGVVDEPVTPVQRVGTKPVATPDPAGAQAIAHDMVLARGWGEDQFSCLVSLWSRESGWRVNAANSSGAYGIPQSLPGSKMASIGADWETNPATQITWGLGYIAARYSTPCGAWSHFQSANSY
ncbi:MAG: hypothetical protein JWN20_2556 [Jatrophihabitantaceae bacterium]|nr:hypothetical protein [Jatrophihabitantaceae bacterium]